MGDVAIEFSMANPQRSSSTLIVWVALQKEKKGLHQLCWLCAPSRSYNVERITQIMTTAETLLQRLLSSRVKLDLLTVFHADPHLVDDVEGLARRTGWTSLEIEADLEDLVELGILKRMRVDDRDVLVLDSARDEEIQRIIAKHLAQGKNSG